ncbi:uncharacterized protein LOC121779672 isoform X3 [Salvia splendens]|uniref:uncharacterized protein LOC121779672 isoform X3 n=1 Tax=Salvia splendens TaxID=180675 RepID=UPI001C25EED0|nr:uncharacterized protein LOC121779672 isoform X3 [Salvia splendens]
MFAKLFQKPTQPQPSPSSLQDVTQETMVSSELAPLVAVHYGIPSTASTFAFDPIQGLLAVGTLDGRIKVIGGGNIEALLISPTALPFKYLEFLLNQGFLVSVSYENEIQVWDLGMRCISSKIKWESTITAFSVISGTNYIYLGDEYGFLSVLKYDAEEKNIAPLPYHIPPNLIAEGSGITLPDHQSIVGVLSQPCLSGNRVLIAYENGSIILWDVTQDKAVRVLGYGDLQLRGGAVVNFSDSESHTHLNDSLDNEETEKEISSLCWVSPDGSMLAVGYVDGDILLWNLSASDSDKGQNSQKSPDDVVKIQLSSGDKKLPVIVLHWSSSKAHNGYGGQLFAYGGVDIGAEEVLTILDLNWSSGLSRLKCIDRVDLTLHGSFADLLVISNSYKADHSSGTSFFVLTSPGQLHFYEYASLSMLKSERGKNHCKEASQYNSLIPTVEPYMTVGKLYMMGSEGNVLGSLSKAFSPTKQHPDKMLTGGSAMWPLRGGVTCQISTSECYTVERIYIGGYHDGSVRIWDASLPVLSLVSVLGSEVKGIEVTGANAPISALDLYPPNLTLAVGNESGLIFLYQLQGDSYQATITIVTETKHQVHHCVPQDGNYCSTIYSILSSPVCALRFATSGVRLVAGFECGQIAVLDTGSASVIFVTDCISNSNSPITSLSVGTCPTRRNLADKSDNETESAPGSEVVIVLTKDAQMVLIDCSTGNMISSQPTHPKEKSIAISMHILDQRHPGEESKSSVTYSQHIEAQNEASVSIHKNQSGFPNAKAVESNFGDKMLASQILLCCEEAFYFYTLESLIQGDNNYFNKIEHGKQCSWSTVIKRDAERYGLVVFYQSGEIELRSLPDLKLLGENSLMSILRWNFKNKMEKTISASEEGQITLVNGCEFALVSLIAYADEFRIRKPLPCLHDEVLAAAADADVNYFQNQKKEERALPGFVNNLMKGLKGDKEEQLMNNAKGREMVIAHLESIFSRFPFSEPFSFEDLELQIDDLDIEEEPVPYVASSQKSTGGSKGEEPVPYVSSSQKSTGGSKDEATERHKLFEGSSTNTKPTVRTTEEIIAKYRNTGDAAGAASQARDKLMERREKLEKLSLRTEELQNGAQNFADMANELAKNMEKRKWWNI